MCPKVHLLNSYLEVGPQHSYCTSVAMNMAVFIIVLVRDRPELQHSKTSQRIIANIKMCSLSLEYRRSPPQWQ